MLSRVERARSGSGAYVRVTASKRLEESCIPCAGSLLARRNTCRSTLHVKKLLHCTVVREYCVYMLKCSDGSYYTGVTSNLEQRVAKHKHGWDANSYTYHRRPVELVYADCCDDVYQAIQWEKQIQGWSRKKKEALIAEDWGRMHVLAMNKKNREKFSSSQRASTRPSTSED